MIIPRNKTQLTRKPLALCMAGGLLLAGSSVSSADAGRPVLEELVVTAQKREESLQDVPIAISAMTGDYAAKAGLMDMQSLSLAVPGLQAQRFAAMFTPYLRGVGSSVVIPGSDPSVALYIDGVYQIDKTSNSMQLFNLERVEVLKGPQGTLFGRNATGGAINLTTRNPGNEFEAEAEFTAANYERFGVNAYVAGPLSDTLSASLMLMKDEQREGFVKEVYRPNPGDVGMLDSNIAMAKVVFEPTDRLSVVGSILYRDISDSRPNVSVAAEGSFIVAEAVGAAMTGEEFPVAKGPGVTSGEEPYSNAESTQYSAKVTYSFDSMDLVSISSYNDSEIFSFVDVDDSPLFIASFAANPEVSENFTQEIHLVSTDDGPLQWTTGLFYSQDEAGWDLVEFYAGTPKDPTPAQLTTVTDFTGAATDSFVSSGSTSVKGDSWAVFAQGTYALTDLTGLTLGVRYTEETKEVDGEEWLRLADSTATDFFLLPTFSFKGDQTWEELTWRLAIDHSFTETTMGYFSYNTGFKSGSWSVFPMDSVPGDGLDPKPFNPETLEAYEIGMKTEFGERIPVRLNTAAFYYDFQDLQVQRGLTEGAVSGISIQNGAEAELYGFEVELTALLTDSLTVKSSVAVLETEFKDFRSAAVTVPNLPLPGNTPTTIDATGNDLLYAPELTANLGLNYVVDLSNGMSLDFNGLVYYNSGFNHSDASGRLEQDSYVEVTGSVALTSADERYFLRLWGKNLTDDERPRVLNNQAPGDSVVWDDPRTYGLTFGVKL